MNTALITLPVASMAEAIEFAGKPPQHNAHVREWRGEPRLF